MRHRRFSRLRNPLLYVRYKLNGRKHYCGPLGEPTDPSAVRYARTALGDIMAWELASEVRLVVRSRERRPVRIKAPAY
jgi:hypothetical protein